MIAKRILKIYALMADTIRTKVGNPHEQIINSFSYKGRKIFSMLGFCLIKIPTPKCRRNYGIPFIGFGIGPRSTGKVINVVAAYWRCLQICRNMWLVWMGVVAACLLLMLLLSFVFCLKHMKIYQVSTIMNILGLNSIYL